MKKPTIESSSYSHKALSRRQFMKIGGVAFFGIVHTALPTFSKEQVDFLPIFETNVTPEDIDKALSVAIASPMSKEAILELQRMEVDIDLSGESVRESSIEGNLVGLVLIHKKSPSARMGANIILTVDLQKETLNVVQFLIGWSLLEMLIVRSVIFDIRNSVYLETLPPNGSHLARTIRPRAEKLWIFQRPEAPHPKPEELVEVGWPPETPETNYWHYYGCTTASWIILKGEPVCICKAIGEQRAKPTDQFQTFDLDYSGYFGTT